MLAHNCNTVLHVSYILEQIMETTSDDELLMSPGMDATIFLVQIGIDYIAYFPFSTLQRGRGGRAGGRGGGIGHDGRGRGREERG